MVTKQASIAGEICSLVDLFAEIVTSISSCSNLNEVFCSHYSANACPTPVCAVFGNAITTVEGIGSTAMLHPVQERLSR